MFFTPPLSFAPHVPVYAALVFLQEQGSVLATMCVQKQWGLAHWCEKQGAGEQGFALLQPAGHPREAACLCCVLSCLPMKWGGWHACSTPWQLPSWWAVWWQEVEAEAPFPRDAAWSSALGVLRHHGCAPCIPCHTGLFPSLGKGFIAYTGDYSWEEHKLGRGIYGVDSNVKLAAMHKVPGLPVSRCKWGHLALVWVG